MFRHLVFKAFLFKPALMDGVFTMPRDVFYSSVMWALKLLNNSSIKPNEAKVHIFKVQIPELTVYNS